MSKHRTPHVAGLLALSITLGFQPAAAQETQLAAVEPRYEEETDSRKSEEPLSDWSLKVCTLVEAAAAAHGLPEEFFTRLIWQESRFRAKAVSPVGARGIAQFMPGTASDRGLENPFDPIAALVHSASLLRDLREEFGNLGLAAAAYNGGPGRVGDWLTGEGGLPRETRNYVWIITGHIAEEWAKEGARKLENENTDANRTARGCEETVALLRKPNERMPMPPSVEDEFASGDGPWGVQVAGSFSRNQAIESWERIKEDHAEIIGDRSPMMVDGRSSRGARSFYRVRIAEQTREAADELCGELKQNGGVCVVLKNS